MGAYDNPPKQVDKSRSILIQSMMNTMQTAFSTIEKKNEWRRIQREKAEKISKAQSNKVDTDFGRYVDKIEGAISTMGMTGESRKSQLDEVYTNMEIGIEELKAEFASNPDMTSSERKRLTNEKINQYVIPMGKDIGYGLELQKRFKKGTIGLNPGEQGHIYLANDEEVAIANILNGFENGTVTSNWTDKGYVHMIEGGPVVTSQQIKNLLERGWTETNALPTTGAFHDIWKEQVAGSAAARTKAKTHGFLEKSTGKYNIKKIEEWYKKDVPYVFDKFLDVEGERSKGYIQNVFANQPDKLKEISGMTLEKRNEALIDEILKLNLAALPKNEKSSWTQKQIEEFDKKFAALKEGEALKGPDGEWHEKTKP